MCPRPVGSAPTNDWEQRYLRRAQLSEREDVVMFINTCFAATGQTEYYQDATGNRLSIDFLHRYVLANYRVLYARCLAAGINHFNQAAIIIHLLGCGAPKCREHRDEEGELIAAALAELPTNRAFALLQRLTELRINNRRTRAVIARYLNERPDQAFTAVKYRHRFRKAAAHGHAKLNAETGRFLFDRRCKDKFETPLFDAFRRAGYSKSAVYELPMTIAESFAQRHGIPRKEFLKGIEPQMTRSERLRMQNAATASRTQVTVDLARTPLTKLALYILSLPITERESRLVELDSAMRTAAAAAVGRRPLQLGRVAAVLDRSRSSMGSRHRQRRPLAVALAADYLLRTGSQHYQSFWTGAHAMTTSNGGSIHPLLVQPGGQTDLAGTLLDAMQTRPDLAVVISDGYENDPPMTADQVVRIAKMKIPDADSIRVIHANPVFDADHFSPRSLGESILTVGLFEAEDLSTMLSFARFAGGQVTRTELESYLGQLSADFLTRRGSRT